MLRIRSTLRIWVVSCPDSPCCRQGRRPAGTEVDPKGIGQFGEGAGDGHQAALVDRALIHRSSPQPQPAATAALSAAPPCRPNELFTGNFGTPIDPQTLNRAF